MKEFTHEQDGVADIVAATRLVPLSKGLLHGCEQLSQRRRSLTRFQHAGMKAPRVLSKESLISHAHMWERPRYLYKVFAQRGKGARVGGIVHRHVVSQAHDEAQLLDAVNEANTGPRDAANQVWLQL